MDTNKKEQRTQGQWGYRMITNSNERTSCFINASNGDTICKMMRDDAPNYQIQEANAKLISASPELLQACIWAKEVIQKLADQGRYPDFLLSENGGGGVTTLTKAIRKATE